MDMATDDERREVAARLRGLDIPVRVKKAEHPEKTASWYELICSAVGGKKDPWFGAKALADRLADLIEPPTQCPYYHSDRHYCSAYDDVVDRHALLKLADRIQHHADNSAGHSAYAARFDLAGWAEVIREACGSDQEG